MDKAEFLKSIQEIGTCEDDSIRRSLLAKVSDEVSKIYDDNENLTNVNNKYVRDNEKLREANMELFIRDGTNKTTEQVVQDNTGITSQQPVEYKSYDELANEFMNK